MDNPTVSWEIRDENDRIISILAWVVVVVLVVYAMIFFYKQINQPSRAARPVVTTVTEDAQGVGTQVASRPETARPRAVVTRISAELDDLPPTSKKVGAPLATADKKQPNDAGIELDIGQYATPAEAIAAMRQLEDVSEWKVRIRAKNEGYTLRAGPLPEKQLASVESSLKAKGMSVERHATSESKGVGSLSSSAGSRTKGSTKPAAKKTPPAATASTKATAKRNSPAARTTRSESFAHDVPGHMPDPDESDERDAPAPRAQRESAQSSGSGYYLQVVTYAEPEMAQETKERYTASGMRARVEKVGGRGTTWYRVMVGAYGSKQEAVAAEQRVAGLIGVNPSELLIRKR